MHDCDFAEVRVHGSEAAEVELWIDAFQPDILIERERNGLLLRSSKLSRDRIEDALLSARVTERMLPAVAERRRAVLMDLMA